MSKELTVEELREKLDEVIAALDEGESVTIVRDGQEIGVFSPSSGLRIVQKGTPYPFRGLELSGGSKELADEAVRLLIEERDYERSGKKYGL
ncbi:MAG TPA: hypothetical protein VF883_04630 [Thermoanaerobaculia bacterium]|jgi:hypothetical protein